MTLREALLERPNSLNGVRLFLASAVILFHAWPLGHAGVAPAWVLPLGFLAVPAFFCLSGFLIASSRMRLPMGRFLWHRTLRIFPALLVVLLVTAFVAAPLSTLGGGSWSGGQAWTYLVENSLLEPVYPIHGTIGDEAWNGSLWSLPYEFKAYICAGLLLSTPAVRRHAPAVVTTVYVSAVGITWWSIGAVSSTGLHYSAVEAQLVTCFLGGMVMFSFSDRIRLDARLAAVSLALVVLLWEGGLMHVFGALPLAYLLLWAGAAIPARWLQRDDISYGVYIYAFPVQVTLEWFVPDLSMPAHVALALLVTFPLALASWRLIERPAMRLRHVSLRSAAPDHAVEAAHSAA